MVEKARDTSVLVFSSFGDTDQSTLTVTCRTCALDQIWLEVSDSRRYASPRICERVFEPYRHVLCATCHSRNTCRR